jgi:uncharacterized protein (TIGR00255 family)
LDTDRTSNIIENNKLSSKGSSMKSMTGFGKADNFGEIADISVEIKSVNGRFLNSRISLPNDYSHLEPILQKIIEKTILRGKVNVWIEIKNKVIPELILNKENLQAYWKLYSDAAEILNIEPQVKLFDLLNHEDIVSRKDNSGKKEIENQIFKTLEKALQEHRIMAENEGNSMKKYFIDSLTIIGNSIKRIKEAFPSYKEEIYRKTENNIENILKQNLGKDDYQRILLESAIWEEKAEV